MQFLVNVQDTIYFKGHKGIRLKNKYPTVIILKLHKSGEAGCVWL